MEYLLFWVKPIAEKEVFESFEFIHSECWIGYPQAEHALIAEGRAFICDATLRCCDYFSPILRCQIIERPLK